MDAPWTSLTPEAGHYLFGYYDRCPWDAAGERHLALRIPQQDRLPVPGETATVGYVDRATRRFHAVAETEAWCHQQGAMTLWLPRKPGCFLFNDFRREGDRWIPIARIAEPGRGIVGEYRRPIYAISPDGRWGVSLAFGRNPRRGYSYARDPLPTDEPFPQVREEGIFVIDLDNGADRLAVSYGAMMDIFPLPYDLQGVHLWLDHASFNVDSSRLMWLFRYCPASETAAPGSWSTNLYTARVDGTDVRCPLPDIYWRHGAISHQVWGREPHEILVDADWCGHGHEYIVFDERVRPMRATRLSAGMGPHAHLVFSPDGRRIAADSYPDHEGWQRLALADTATGRLAEIGRFRHPPIWGPNGSGKVDLRCDLHPRWSPDGLLLTVDTIHEGERKIYMRALG